MPKPVTASFGPAAPVPAAKPNARLDKPPKAKIKAKGKKASVSVAFSADASASTFKCKLDTAPFAPCTSPFAFKAKVGRHTFTVMALNAAGEAGTAAAAGFKVVKAAPKK